MELKLHANATTTPKTRAYIQASSASVAELAAELGVSEATVRRWKKRSSVEDRSHTPHKLLISLSPLEEGLLGELRRRLWLSLDDLTEVMQRCVNPELSRSSIHAASSASASTVSRPPQSPKSAPSRRPRSASSTSI